MKATLFRVALAFFAVVLLWVGVLGFSLQAAYSLWVVTMALWTTAATFAVKLGALGLILLFLLWLERRFRRWRESRAKAKADPLTERRSELRY